MHQNPVGLFQRICAVIHEGLTNIVLEHVLEVKHEMLTERVQNLGESLGMCVPVNFFPRIESQLCLDDFLPRMPGFVREEIYIQFEGLWFICGDGKPVASTFIDFLLASFAAARAD